MRLSENSSMFTALDLFCGAGGLTCGLKMAGFDVLAGVELNAVAAETYRTNYPDHKLYEADITTLSPESVMTELGLKKGELDLLAGCPPCQGFSSHRTRNKASSVDDSRNELAFEFLRFVETFLPKTVMMENVPALAKDHRINIIIERLTKLGYIVNDDTVSIKDCSDYDVPQRRKRMILIASRLGIIEHPKKSEKKITVRDAIGGMENNFDSIDPLHNSLSKRSEKVMMIIKSVPKDGGSRSQIPYSLWLDCHKKNPNSYRDVYGRMSWDNVAPTITGGCVNPSKGRFIHPSEDRTITLREAALIQSFPSDYYFSMRRGKESAALMIGNALPPKFIMKHALEFIKHLENAGGIHE